MPGAIDRLAAVADLSPRMRTFTRSRSHDWILVLAAVVTLLPPGAWSLCFDREAGHVEIEPTAIACTENRASDAAADASCGNTSHDECEDYVLLSGQVTTTRDSHLLVDDAHAVPVAPLFLATTPVPGPAPHVVRVVRPFTPPTAPTILRC